MKKITFLLLIATNFLLAQTVTNDVPSAAISLSVGANFADSSVVGDNTNATASEATDSTIPDPGCASYNGGDVWYSVQVPEGGSVIIQTDSNNSTSFTDGGLAVYSGTIGNLSLVQCNDDGGNGGFSSIELNGRTSGELLYIRVWEFGGNTVGEFQISAWFFTTPPINDEPSGAIALMLGDNFEDEVIADDNFLATSSEDLDNTIPEPNCGFYEGNDLWYTVQVPATGNVNIEADNLNNDNFTLFDLNIAVYSGSIGNLTLEDCNSFIQTGNSLSFISVTDATPGDILYVRAWVGGANDQGTFQISAWATPEITPVNDDPSGATNLTVGTFFSNEVIIDDNVVATASESADPSIPAPGCANYNGADVWYTVTVPQSGHLNIETDSNGASSLTDTGIAIYSGTIGNLTLLDCNDEGPDSFFGNHSLININGGTPGEVLYIRVWADSGDQSGTFQISAWEGIAPGNNNPSSFFSPELTVGGNFSSNAITGTNVLATNSEDTNSNIPAPNCGSYNGSDVWYTVELPSDGIVIVQTQAEEDSRITSTGLALYSGNSINELVLESCSDPVNGFAITSLVGTPGEIIYVRVWETGGDIEDTFQIAAFNNLLSPENDDPGNATHITVGADFDSEPITSSNLFATDSEVTNNTIPNPNCASYNGGDVWFTVDVPSDGNITIETAQSEGSFLDTGMAVYSGTNLLNLSLVACNDDGAGNSSSIITLEDRTPSETLYVRVWEFSGDNNAEFLISAWNPDIATLSVDSNIIIEGLSYYPNPVKDILTISTQSKIETFTLYSSNGQEIKALTLNNNKADMSNLPTGIYFAKVSTENGTQTFSIIRE